MNAPRAKKIDKILEIHGDRRIDPYYWMNERDNPEVIKYLEEENAYCDFQMRDTETFQQQLFDEMKARYKEDDESLPYFFNGYWYISRFEIGKEYPIFSRKFQTLENAEEILLDVNILAEGHYFMEVGSVAVSPDNKLMSYSSDNMGRRIYSLNFKNLESGELFEGEIHNTTGKAVWAQDNRHVFYIRKDESLRAFQVWRHLLGTNPDEDVLIFDEEDCALFSVLISQYIPIVPNLVRNYNVLGYELNKFGFTFIAVGGFYITRSLMTYLFFAGTGSGRRWDIFYFTSSKFYFIFSLVLLGMCIVEFYFPVHRGQLFSVYISIIGLIFISKIIYYLAHPAGMLPKQWYYKFLYICTLQIVPVLVLWRLFFI